MSTTFQIGRSIFNMRNIKQIEITTGTKDSFDPLYIKENNITVYFIDDTKERLYFDDVAFNILKDSLTKVVDIKLN